jgi:beta-glucosidase
MRSIQSLNLAQQVAQMMVIRTAGYLFDHQIQYPQWEIGGDKLRDLIHAGVGGVIFLGGSAGEMALQTQHLQSWARQSPTQIPLLLCADVEEGVGQRFSGATWFPPPMAIGAIAQRDLALACHYAEQMGAATAQEALAIGLNWILAPTVDVNNNPKNPVINIRAFGETPDIVSALGQAFLRGAQQHPILTCAKHFPGHGDTDTDSHLALPVIAHDLARLRTVELPPFAAAIQAQVDAVMTAHLQLPALDADRPTTMSPPVLTGLLRQELGFDGLIVTDAMVMGAITDRYSSSEAAILAVLAGADVIMMPQDPLAAISGLVEAVESGRVSADRIAQSVARIFQAKAKFGPAPLPQDLTQTVGLPQVRAAAAAIARDSMTVHHPAQSRLHDPGWQQHRRNLVLVDSGLDSTLIGRMAPAIDWPQQRGYETLQIVDAHTPPVAFGAVETRQPTLLQLFIRGNPLRGSAALTGRARDWFEYLLQTEQLQALVLYGSPYNLAEFTDRLPADVPYVFSYGQLPIGQHIALKALFAQTTATQTTGMDGIF